MRHKHSTIWCVSVCDIEPIISNLRFQIQTEVFPSTNGGAKAMADAFQVPFLGRLPLDPNMTNACEDGISFVEAFPTSSASASFQTIVNSMCSAHLRSFRTLY